MTIPAKYENGVFKPLASVDIQEGTIVNIYSLSRKKPSRARSATSASLACGPTAMTSQMA